MIIVFKEPENPHCFTVVVKETTDGADREFSCAVEAMDAYPEITWWTRRNQAAPLWLRRSKAVVALSVN